MLKFTDPSRREFLEVGSLAGLTLPMLLQAKARGAEAGRNLTTGKSVIFLFMGGGPSQYETFDPKMGNPTNNRSATGEVTTSVPGLTFGGTFDRLAPYADRLAIVRSFTTENGGHNSQPFVSKSSLNANIGSLYSRVVGPLHSNGLPSNVTMVPSSVDSTCVKPRITDLTSSGSLGGTYAAFVPGSGGQMQQNMQLSIARDRVTERRTLLGQIDRLRRQAEADASLAAVDKLHEQAFDVILGSVADAFNLNREDQRLVDRYDTVRFDRPEAWAKRGHRTSFTNHARGIGKQLLLARRLCELGCGFVSINTDFAWDHHDDGNNIGVHEMALVSDPFQHALCAFIDDIEARGLSEKILLIATGEMGRTPNISGKSAGNRDHWGKIAPLLLYGGGLTRGQLIGQSSRNGGEPASEPMTPKHLIGTIMHTLFNVAEARVTPGITGDLMRIITEYPTIPGLF